MQAEELAGVGDADLSGRTALVTGSTSGVGREVALALGRLGATVFVHGRDRAAGRGVVEAVEDAGGSAAFLRAEFAAQAAVRKLAAAVRERAADLDVLVHNAGASFGEGQLTGEGIERTFAVNHVAPFLLTDRLADHLATDARVVVTASEVHRRADGRFTAATLRSVAEYDALAAYARSKLANVLFARALARRLDDALVNATHPGFVPGSGIWRTAPRGVRAATGLLAALPDRLVPFARTPVEGAVPLVRLAAAPDLTASGAYFDGADPVPPSPGARDDAGGERLWRATERLAGLG